MSAEGGLNPEPTDLQRAQWRKHKLAGTSPGNPKWYKPVAIAPFVFKAGLAPIYPKIESGATWFHRHESHQHPDPFKEAAGKADLRAYVAAYDAARGLVSVPF